MSNEDRQPVSMVLSLRIWEDIKIAAIRRKMEFGELAEQAMREWLKRNSKEKEVASV